MSEKKVFHQAQCSIQQLRDFDELVVAELDKLLMSLLSHHSSALAAVKDDYERKLQAMQSNEPVSKVEVQRQLQTSPKLNEQSALCSNTLEQGALWQGGHESLSSFMLGSGHVSPVSKTEELQPPVALRSSGNATFQGGSERSDPDNDKRRSTPMTRKSDGKKAKESCLFDEEDFYEFPIQAKARPTQKGKRSSDNAPHGRNSAERPAFSKWMTSEQPAAFQKWLSMNDDRTEMQLRDRGDFGIASQDSQAFSAHASETTWTRWSQWIFDKRQSAANFLRHPATEVFIAVTILTNSIVVGIEVDWTVKNPKETSLPIGFSIFGYAFNILLLIEIGLRMFVLMGKFFTGSQSGWNMFDLSLVIASAIEIMIELLYRAGTENFSNLRIVRMILSTLLSVFWAMLLLVIILYTFGMLFAQAASEHIAEHRISGTKDHIESLEDVERYWSTVPRSMFTLYKAVTGGVDWENVTMALSKIHWFWVGTFLVFLSFTVFAVLNTVVGVFCQSAIQTAQSDHENSVRLKLREKQLFIRKIRTLFLDIEKSQDGVLTYHEFLKHLDDEQVVAYFQILGIDPTDTSALFKLLSKTGSQLVDVEEFIEGCLRLRGPAKCMDIAKVMFENRIMRKQLTTLMSQIQSNLNLPASSNRSRLLSHMSTKSSIYPLIEAGGTEMSAF